jgi:microcystin-dependent protein
MEDRDRIQRTSGKRPYVVGAVVGALVVGAGALVYASVPHTFATGETLTADNLNGNFSALDQRLAAVEAVLLPSGTIIAYGGPASATTDGGAPAVPAGWLLCDGSAVSRTTYANLFAAIGINFGGGDGIGTFNLPDLRGRFLRGVDHGAGRDPNAAARTASNTGGQVGDAVGTLQGQATALPTTAFTTNTTGDHNHFNGVYHRLMATEAESGHVSSTTTATDSSPSEPDIVDSAPEVNAGNHSHSVTAGGDSETRPKNVGVNYLIKL